VTEGNNRFTYAAIFCAIAALFGTVTTIAPRLLEIVKARRHPEEDGEKNESGKTTPA
jgi:hypothetical protein